MDTNSLEAFRAALHQKGLYYTTVKKYLRAVQHFYGWCLQGGIDFENPSKDDFYTYKRDYPHLAAITWVERFAALRHWYQFTGIAVKVPIIKIRNQGKIAYDGLLDEPTLLQLYQAVPNNTLVGRRNKAVVSLIIFQGLNRKTISLLESHHLNLEAGSISVPRLARTNPRVIPLHPAQIPALMDYVNRYRLPLLQEQGINSSPWLFTMPSTKGGSRSSYESFKSSVTRYLPELRKHFPRLRDWTQVRQSRIMVWIKTYPLRKAQYLSGIKHISSMHGYAQGDITKLQNSIAQNHPLG